MTDPDKKSGWTGRVAVVACALALLAAYLLVPAAHSWVDGVVAMFSTGDFTVIRDFVAEYGIWAAAVSFALMIFQSVAAPLPAFLITFANASLFGWWQGALLSWASAMAGAAACFWIARLLGRDVVERLITKSGLASVEGYFARHGNLTILICRLLPFVSFDFVSYAAGLTSMSFGGFMLATGIGQLPATIVYSYVGGMLTGGAKTLAMALFILFALAGVIVLARQLYTEHVEKAAVGDIPGQDHDALADKGQID